MAYRAFFTQVIMLSLMAYSLTAHQLVSATHKILSFSSLRD
ncbi:hypothetical protein BofuT4_uP155960.1 [Botrytis cinerea T4]|uniref:Uncharacterized protein n=1 Tax=Botryotinia fuckeliana (strain T4) TaxID=999810 RepID=G2YUA2_BOTF4|nr:hypothetical protein BofuT4_uP155960.1 [Botrytis cinerea T4]